jgi:YebC/PmpR family DNA-binding regulatory protein
MAGHSKWANIKFRKSAQDAKRGKLFTKLIREITVAAKMGGEDVTSNPRLRTAIDKALVANMTRDTIDRAIKRGAGGQEDQDLEEIRYEGYGPCGIAVMVDCLSNNRNRTVSHVRHTLTKFGGSLGTNGSVAYLFNRKGQLVFAPGNNEELIMELGLEAEVDDVVVNDDGSIEVFCPPENFHNVLKVFKEAGLEPDSAEISYIPSTYTNVEEEEIKEKVRKMLDMLEDCDDVQNVYTNAEGIFE